MEDAQQYLQCPTPEPINTTSDWSASVSRCPKVGVQSASVHGTWIEGPTGNYLFWEQELDQGLDYLGAQPTFDPWLDALTPAPVAAHPDLSLVYTTVPPLAAARVFASFTATWPGASTSVETVVTGIWSPDGRFDVTAQIPSVADDGSPNLIESRVAFDGAVLTVMAEGSPDAMAFFPGTAQATAAFRHQAPWARFIMSWLIDPFALNSESDISWSSADVGASERMITRTSGAIQQTLLVDLANNFSPERMELLGSGNVFARRTFANYQDLGDGVMRPKNVTQSTLFGVGGTSYDESLLIRRVELLDELPAGFGRVEPGEDLWVIVP